MSSNVFFKRNKIKINNIFPNINLSKNFDINDIKPLPLAKKNDLTFFDSIKYQFDAIKTKGSACITTKRLEKFCVRVI